MTDLFLWMSLITSLLSASIAINKMNIISDTKISLDIFLNSFHVIKNDKLTERQKEKKIRDLSILLIKTSFSIMFKSLIVFIITLSPFLMFIPFYSYEIIIIFIETPIVLISITLYVLINVIFYKRIINWILNIH